jgi:hypothetical protein
VARVFEVNGIGGEIAAAHADVEAWINSWKEPDEKPMPDCA